MNNDPAIKDTATEPPGMFTDWGWPQWLMLALCVIILLVLIYALYRIISHKIKMKRMVNTLREDLLLRRELAAMAAGKDKKAQEKEQFLRMESIRMDVHSAHEAMKDHGISPRKTGAWLLLGEPGSGKSRLMESGGMEYPAGLNDFSRASEATSTLNLWMTGNGTVWDIGGRLFLSRWGGRQNNEWLLFLKEFHKVYKNSLPNGVILTIPADALLLDTPARRYKKFSLIAEELRALAHETGVFCPIWFVITKCDQIDGFSEFFSLLNDSACENMLGWENHAVDNDFEQSVYDTDFDKLCDKLKSLRSSYAMNESVWERTENGQKRADIVTPIYLFPEKFASMKENLGLYVAGIFAHVRKKKRTRGVFQFQGCWFTAVLDQPVVAMERLVFETDEDGIRTSLVPEQEAAPVSSNTEGKLDSSGIISVREKIVSLHSDRHYFSARLLMNNITQAVERCDYTDAAVERIRKPYFIAAGILLGVAAPICLWAWHTQHELANIAARDLAFWSNTQQLFESGTIASSPVLTTKDGEQIPCLNEPIGNGQTSRRKYLDSLRNMCSLTSNLPYFWYPASWLVDGEFSGKLMHGTKDYIDKAAIVSMLLKPATDAGRAMLEHRSSLEDALREAWTLDDTKMLSSLLKITYYGILLTQGKDVTDDVDYGALVRLDDTPVLNSAVKSLWMSTVSNNKTMAQMSELNGHLRPVSMEAAAAIDKGVALYEHGIKDMDIYPELKYATMTGMLHNLKKLMELRSTMREAERDYATAVTRNDYTSMKEGITLWSQMYAQANDLYAKIKAAEKNLQIENATSLNVCFGSQQRLLKDKLQEDRKNFKAMTEGLEDSINSQFLRTQEERLEKAISCGFDQMDKDHSLLTEELCLFWDKSSKESNVLRPVASFMEYVNSLNELISYPIPRGTPDEQYQRRILRINLAKKQYDAKVEDLLKNKDHIFDEECWNRNWKILQSEVILDWLQQMPHNKVELTNSFEQTNLPKLPPMTLTRAHEHTVMPAFAPEAMDKKIKDLQALSAYIHEQFQEEVGKHDETILYKLKPLDEILDSYLNDYVIYWTEHIPAKYKIQDIRTWLQFVESADMLRSADVAGNLQELNRFIINALEMPCLNDEKRYPLAAQRKALVLRNQKDITNEVTHKIMQSAEFISKMNTEPAKAWKELSTLDAEDIFSTYWAAWNPNTDAGSFLWWNNYLELGMRLLKDEASRSLKESVQSCLPTAALFPLCNVAERQPTSTLDKYSIEDLADRLVSIGAKQDDEKLKKMTEQAEKLNIPDSLGELKLPMIRNRVQAWQKIGAVIDLLSSPELPLTCELILPPSEVRVAATDGEPGLTRVIPVGRRFPFCRIICGGDIMVDTFSLNKNSEKEVTLSDKPIPADTGNLELQFFRFSNSKTPDSTLKFSAAWSAVNMYLRSGVRLSEDQKTAYVPLIFTDREGYTCQFWIGLKFNKPMIAPGNWPGIDIFDSAVVKKTSTLQDAEKSMRKLMRSTFLTKNGHPKAVKQDERLKLRQDLDDLLSTNYSLVFEVVTPDKQERRADDRLLSATLFPCFAIGDEDAGTAKLRTMPDVTTSAETLIPGSDTLNLRVYRHVTDQFPAHYIRKNKPLQYYAIEQAAGYSPLTGYLTVPVPVPTPKGNIPFYLYLRPVLVATPDDGLLPDISTSPLIEYPTATPANR